MKRWVRARTLCAFSLSFCVTLGRGSELIPCLCLSDIIHWSCSAGPLSSALARGAEQSSPEDALPCADWLSPLDLVGISSLSLCSELWVPALNILPAHTGLWQCCASFCNCYHCSCSTRLCSQGLPPLNWCLWKMWRWAPLGSPSTTTLTSRWGVTLLLSSCREENITHYRGCVRRQLYCKDTILIQDAFLVLQAELLIQQGSGYFFIDTSVPNIVRVTHEETQGIALVSAVFCGFTPFCQPGYCSAASALLGILQQVWIERQ